MNIRDKAKLNFPGNVTFNIVGDTELDYFGITNSGVVKLKRPLDREEKAHYFIAILARSSKFLDFTTLKITVLDENDNSPAFKSGSCYTLALPENEESAAIHTIAASDTDDGKNGEIFYSIVSK